MAPREATARLRKELALISKDPPPFIHVAAHEKNILDWDYLLEGPPETPYEGGWYHGRIRFPPEYPRAPPEIVMYTPSGRFQVSTALCLSMSNFHPESWNPIWSVATILKGLLSFMCEDTETQGSVVPATTAAEKRAFAKASIEANSRNPTFRKLFADFDEIRAAAESRGQAPDPRAAPAEPAPATSDQPPEAVAAAECAESAPAAAAPDAPAAAAAPVGLPAKAAASSFSDGDEVSVQGLSARADLNGETGIVVGRQGARYQVRFGDKVVSLRPGNLVAK
eukprot:TRINITY_DN6068_c0_g1_i1.p1 TRINITY_DN6068_c0_g1~~TRINITY_DN6068_c0_g1_i1.p1  ORF type:complete len:316 (+),score=40.31 TRINITY_DN6068_c0_g1_i1:107-949(+)